MKISLRILTACALAACSLAVMAQNAKALQLLPRGTKIDPIRVAKAVLAKDANGKLTWKRTGQWIPYQSGAHTAAQDVTTAYDEYEWADPANADMTPGDNPGYTGCGTAGSRCPGYPRAG